MSLLSACLAHNLLAKGIYLPGRCFCDRRLRTAVVAGELPVKIADGRATLIAEDVPIQKILAEWGGIGETKMVNAEKMTGAPLTLSSMTSPRRKRSTSCFVPPPDIWPRLGPAGRGGIAVRPGHDAGHRAVRRLQTRATGANIQPLQGSSR